MSAIRLNATAIALNRLPFPLVPPADEITLDSTTTPLVVSRRDVVKAAGVAAAFAAGALSLRSLEPLPEAHVGTHARSAWLRCGWDRTVLDPAVFGGHPSLTVESNGSWHAALTRAVFPGTTLPAGIDLLVTGSGPLAKLHIAHELGGFRAVVPLAQWLSGQTAAESWVDLSRLRVPLADGSVLRFNGGGVASLRPDWSVRIEGTGIAELEGSWCRAVADVVTIGLAEPDSATLFSRNISRRTFVTLERGGHEWRLDLPKAAGEAGISIGAQGPQLLTLEAAQTRAGAIYQAVSAQSPGRSTALFSPADGGGSIDLDGARVGWLLDGSDSFHLAADFARAGMWLTTAGRAMLVEGAEWGTPFECFGDSAGVTIAGKPAVRALSVGIPGVISSPLTFPEGSRVVTDLSKMGLGLPLLPKALLPPGPGSIINLPPLGDFLSLIDGTYVDVIRREDMLSLRFTFYNFKVVTTADGSAVQRNDIMKPAYVAVRFPSQHTLEQAIQEVGSNVSNQLKPPLKSYLSGDSRLVFQVASARADAGIGLNLADLLDWAGFTQYVMPVAERGLTPGANYTASMAAPSASGTVDDPPDTALELPWGLYLSPNERAWWKHRTLPKTDNGRTELWHTRLTERYVSPGATSLDVGASALPPGTVIWYPPTLRPIWARYYDQWLAGTWGGVTAPSNDGLGHSLFRNSFTTVTSEAISTASDIGGLRNRWAVVDIAGRYQDAPIDVDNLMLTPLGGWLDSRATLGYKTYRDKGWPVAEAVVGWDHRATMGRDQYVKIVKLGRLFPFGHEAAEITITERRVDTATKMAFLGQKKFITVLQPVVEYEQESEPLNRRMPFRSVEIKTKKTPQITHGHVNACPNDDLGFWVKTVTPAANFLFQMTATDWDGTVQQFEMPLIFIDDRYGSYTTGISDANTIIDPCIAAMRAVGVAFKGQKTAFANSSGSEDPNRVLPATTLWFEAVRISPSTFGEVLFYPLMYQAQVRVDAVEELTGQDKPTIIKIASIYSANGYAGANADGRVFAEIVGGGKVDFPPEMAGGVANPIPMLSGISAHKGVFGGDLAQFGQGALDANQFFDVSGANLMGGISLVELLLGGLNLDTMPVFERFVDPEDPGKLTVRYTLTVPITDAVTIFVPSPDGCTLTLKTEITKRIDGAGETTTTIRGEVGPFTLVLVRGVLEALEMQFGLFTFESVNGSSPSIVPAIENVKFVDKLEFLQVLAQFLGAMSGASSALAAASGVRPSGSAGAGAGVSANGDVTDLATMDAGPFKIDISPKEISASLTIAIPNVTVGVFSLTNMSFGAALHIPFTGEPVWLEFSFCSRENPFSLMVTIFGGGGYVIMSFDTKGLKAVEISLEFGVGCAFSIGSLATGSVEVKGGTTFRYQAANDEIMFAAFIRIQGNLEVLGLIRVTITFYLELAYRSWAKPLPEDPEHKGNELTGTATLTVEIEILFFSVSVELSVTKTLAGEDPRFAAMMPEQSYWAEYCTAFAPAQLGA